MSTKPKAFLAAVAVVLAAASTGCESPIEVTYEPYSFDAPDGAAVDAEIGRFQVPENRSDRGSRDITLGFVRLKSTSDNPGPPIVYLAGGPGGSGISELYGRRYELFDRLRAVADVIAFDQRGTGESNDVPVCKVPEGDIPALETPLTRDLAAEFYTEQARRCEDFWAGEGVDLGGYNTLESVADLDDLRRVLGAEKISLWSISYGSHLAMAAMKEMPDGIDRVVMAGSEGPDETVKLPANSEAFLTHVDELVSRSAGDRYPKLLETMHQVLDEVERDPVVVSLEQGDGTTVDVGVSRFVLQAITGFLVKNPEEMRALPAFYYGMAAGDFRMAAQSVMQMRDQNLSGLSAMSLGMDYASGVSEERLALVRGQARDAAMGDAMNFPIPHILGGLEIDDLGADFRRPVETDVPTLFLSGTLDGRTFLPAHEETKRGFSQATHVIIENAGHDMFMSHADLGGLIADFFAGVDIGDQRLHLDPPSFY